MQGAHLFSAVEKKAWEATRESGCTPHLLRRGSSTPGNIMRAFCKRWWANSTSWPSWKWAIATENAKLGSCKHKHITRVGRKIKNILIFILFSNRKETINKVWKIVMMAKLLKNMLPIHPYAEKKTNLTLKPPKKGL